MNDLKSIWSALSPESDFWLLVLLWAIAIYLYCSQFHLSWVQFLGQRLGVEQSSVQNLWLKFNQVLVVLLSLVPFLLLGLAGHLFFLWGFGHIWSVSLSLLGCISGAIYELIRQNDTLGSS